MKTLIFSIFLLFSCVVSASGGHSGTLKVKESVFRGQASDLLKLLSRTEYLELKDGTILEAEDIKKILEEKRIPKPIEVRPFEVRSPIHID